MIKKQYIAPHLTSVEFKTERGYATSTLANISLAADAANHFIETRATGEELWNDNNYINSSIENRGTGSTFAGGWTTNDASTSGDNDSYFGGGF